jgi:hypothetical protein
VLTQIIVEQEQKGAEPAADQLSAAADQLLRRQHAVPGAALPRTGDGSFARNQEQMRTAARDFGIFPFGQFEEMGKQNIGHVRAGAEMLSPLWLGATRNRPRANRPPPPSRKTRG